MNTNPVVAITKGNALPVTSYIFDTSNPILEEFDLDMNTVILTLTFDETVEICSFDVTGITLVIQVLHMLTHTP